MKKPKEEGLSKDKEILKEKNIFLKFLILIFSGVIFFIIFYIIFLLIIFNFILILLTKKPSSKIQKFIKEWINEFNRYIDYLVFYTEEKPFPFD